LSALAVWGALLLLGPFAFPLLWKSPAFNRFWKIALTVVFTALTVYLLWGTGEIIKYVLKEAKQLQLI
jgi:hypothetical protein